MPPDQRPDWVLQRRRQIGHHIARLRGGRGLSIDDVATAAGLDRKTVMRVEAGTVSTGLDVLLQLAAGLSLPLADLVQDDEAPRSPR